MKHLLTIVFILSCIASQAAAFRFNYFNNPDCIEYAIGMFEATGIRPKVITTLTNLFSKFAAQEKNNFYRATSAGWIEASTQKYFDFYRLKFSPRKHKTCTVLNCYMTSFLLLHSVCLSPTSTETRLDGHYSYLTNQALNDDQIKDKELLFHIICGYLAKPIQEEFSVQSIDEALQSQWRREGVIYPQNGMSLIQVVCTLKNPFVDHAATVFQYLGETVMVESQTGSGPYMIARFKSREEMYGYLLEFYTRCIDKWKRDFKFDGTAFVMVYDNGVLAEYKKY